MHNLLKLSLLFIFISFTQKTIAQQVIVSDSVRKIDTVARKISKDTSVATAPQLFVPYRYRNIKRRSPLLAAGLSAYIMGAGQVYNKQYIKAGAIVAVECVTFVGALVSSLNHQEFFNPDYHSRNGAGTALFLSGLFADYLYNIIDAAASADHLNEKYNLPRHRRSFTSLHIAPNVMNTDNGTGRQAYGFSLVLR
jgi:hypothetical protein